MAGVGAEGGGLDWRRSG